MTTKPTILLIDDDIDLCHSIEKLLSQHGFKVIITHDSENIDMLLKNNQIDLILLDIIIPGNKDGIALCKLIRQVSKSPIIMLTGIETDVEKVVSLEVGADNYITKPFSSRVLIAQINAALRRTSIDSSTNHTKKELVSHKYQVMEFQNFKLNIDARILLSSKNEVIKLTTTEFILLQGFIQNPQCVLSRNQLLDMINTNNESFDRSIDVLISKLRAKLANDMQPLINTVRNAGYTFTSPVNKLSMDSEEWQNLLLSTA